MIVVINRIWARFGAIVSGPLADGSNTMVQIGPASSGEDAAGVEPELESPGVDGHGNRLICDCLLQCLFAIGGNDFIALYVCGAVRCRFDITFAVHTCAWIVHISCEAVLLR